MHWQSDVDSGHIMGSIIVATLHSNTVFIQSLSLAKEEFKKVLIPKSAVR